MSRTVALRALLCLAAVLAGAAALRWLAPPVVLVNDPKAFQGYTLIFPLKSTETYLVDMQGRVVHSWHSAHPPGEDAHLLKNGHLLRPAQLSGDEALLTGAGAGGLVREFTWDGQLVWDFKFHNDSRTQHHSVTPMPNGEVMLIVWERKTAEQALRAGVKLELAAGGDRLVDSLFEIRPKGKSGGEVVWEWHVWDHLVQDHDPTRANYGVVAEHPELIDINYGRNRNYGLDSVARYTPLTPWGRGPVAGQSDDEALDKLQSIGYVGSGGGKRFQDLIPDWTHVNAVAYNARLDQVMLCCREFHEVWVIDHSTTTAEAAGHAGGRSGKGGDLLYRWGNPQTYRAGTDVDQRLFAPHDAHWIPDGLPGAGHVLVFNNGLGRPDGSYSSVEEIVPPLGAQGRYARPPGSPYGPSEAAWRYPAPDGPDCFSALLSGAQRLPNGNTLICLGLDGTLIEVTAKKAVVWEYVYPAPLKSSRALFRAYRYGLSYPGLAGRDLTPGTTMPG
jgi:hypothetical protein